MSLAQFPARLRVLALVNGTLTAGRSQRGANRHLRAPVRQRAGARAHRQGQADTRAIASATSIYAAHCGGLPTGNGTNCATSPGETSAIPGATLNQQRNQQNQIGGPFLNAQPVLPAGWGGTGGRYTYIANTNGTFEICATGDLTGANSNGGATCP